MNEKAMEALEVYGNQNNPEWLRVEAKEVIRLALAELTEIKGRADKVIFTYALDILDIKNEIKHGDLKIINDFIEAIEYIVKGEAK